jgi:hypothetical protein
MQIATQLSFEWCRGCAGYDIVAPLKRWEGWAKLGQQAQPGRGSFPAREEKWSHRVKARKGGVQTYRPLDDAGLYKRFAKLEFEPAAYRDFADKFGLLIAGDSMTLWTFVSFHACLRRALGEKIPKWVLEQVTHCHRDLPAQVRARSAQDVNIDRILHRPGNLPPGIGGLSRLVEGGCTPGVVPNAKHGHTTLVIRPRDLMVAIALQAIKHLSGEDERMGVKLLDCKRCGAPFEVGPGTGRRSRAMFCSRACQNESHYAMRKAEAMKDSKARTKPGRQEKS